MKIGKRRIETPYNSAVTQILLSINSESLTSYAIAKKLNKAQSTIYEHLQTLEKEEYVSCNTTKQYSLSYVKVISEFINYIQKNKISDDSFKVVIELFKHVYPGDYEKTFENFDKILSKDEQFKGILKETLNYHSTKKTLSEIYNELYKLLVYIAVSDFKENCSDSLQEFLNFIHATMFKTNAGLFEKIEKYF